jgi:hypothetical protein
MKHKYCTIEDVRDVNDAGSYEDLLKIALRILPRMKGPIVQVCGPIETGGRGTVEDNLTHLDEVINQLINKDAEVFDQIFFEEAIKRMKADRRNRGDLDYDFDLLNKFYLPILESGLISKLYFVSGWETSTGARWEYEQSVRLGIEADFLGY